MKLRSFAPFALGVALLCTTGCPENTYPAGEKDAYPLTDPAFFIDGKGESLRTEHKKGEDLRNALATAPIASREAILKDLNDPARMKKEKDEDDSLEKTRPVMRLILARLFGSPEHPSRPSAGATGAPSIGPISTSLASIEEPGSPLDTGRRLYKQHCMHCHGFYGYGDGPTANFLLPKPRDFRWGKVKFTSTKNGARPVHDDIVRTIAQGIPGTMMPAFGPHEGIPQIGIFAGHAGPPDFDVDAVASYIELLLMRGSVEQQLAAKWGDDGELTKDNAQEAVNQVFGDWQTANDNVVKPETARPKDFEASAKNGEKLFGYMARTDEAKKAAKAGCFTCHGIRGLGVDSSPEDIGVVKQEDCDKVLLQLNDYKLPSMPLNLTFGTYRGGRRPIDLYRRIYSSVKGTAMPAQAGNLTSDEIWNVVDFLYKLGAPKPEKAE